MKKNQKLVDSYKKERESERPEPLVVQEKHIPETVQAKDSEYKKSIDEFRASVGLPVLKAKERTCLTCGKMFPSEHAGNRRCELCDATIKATEYPSYNTKKALARAKERKSDE